MSLRLTLLRRADVGLGVLVGFLYGAIGASACGTFGLDFGKETNDFSVFFTVVLCQMITLVALFALVRAMVANDGGQIAVLWPHS